MSYDRFTTWGPHELNPDAARAWRHRLSKRERQCIATGTNLDSTPYVIRNFQQRIHVGLAQSPPPNAVDVTGISCSSLLDCVAVGDSGNIGAGSTIMNTNSGGLAWTNQTPPAGTSRLLSASCPTTAICFAAGIHTVLFSSNAGYAWNAQGVPSEVSGLNGISCATTAICTAVGFGIFGSPELIGTTNGGSSWSIEPIPARSRRPHRGLMFESHGLSGG